MTEEATATMLVGMNAESFLESDVGRYLLGCASQEAAEAYEKLKNADPEDSKTIRQLQNQIWRAESFKQWLEEIINAGRQADQTLRDQDEA